MLSSSSGDALIEMELAIKILDPRALPIQCSWGVDHRDYGVNTRREGVRAKSGPDGCAGGETIRGACTIMIVMKVMARR